MKRRFISFTISFIMVISLIGGLHVAAESQEEMTIYHEVLGKDVTYVKWNGLWAAKIETQEELDQYLEANTKVVEDAINASFTELEPNLNNNPPISRASTYSKNVLVRKSGGGTFSLECRLSYTVSNNKITQKKTYGVLTGITAGVRYEEKTATATLVNNNKSVKCYIAGQIVNYIFFKGIGDVYTTNVTSGGTVNIL